MTRKDFLLNILSGAVTGIVAIVTFEAAAAHKVKKIRQNSSRRVDQRPVTQEKSASNKRFDVHAASKMTYEELIEYIRSIDHMNVDDLRKANYLAMKKYDAIHGEGSAERDAGNLLFGALEDLLTAVETVAKVDRSKMGSQPEPDSDEKDPFAEYETKWEGDEDDE